MNPPEQIVERMEAIVSLLSPGMDETDRECAYIEMEDLARCVRDRLASPVAAQII